LAVERLLDRAKDRLKLAAALLTEQAPGFIALGQRGPEIGDEVARRGQRQGMRLGLGLVGCPGEPPLVELQQKAPRAHVSLHHVEYDHAFPTDVSGE
jgi:hypothetical protein